MSEVVTLEVANRWEAFADKALAGETLTRGGPARIASSRAAGVRVSASSER